MLTLDALDHQWIFLIALESSSSFPSQTGCLACALEVMGTDELVSAKFNNNPSDLAASTGPWLLTNSAQHGCFALRGTVFVRYKTCFGRSNGDSNHRRVCGGDHVYRPVSSLAHELCNEGAAI